jgi:hypothetical protein
MVSRMSGNASAKEPLNCLQARQGAWGSRDVSHVVGSQEVGFGLQVALVVSLDPPSNDGLVLFC